MVERSRSPSPSRHSDYSEDDYGTMIMPRLSIPKSVNANYVNSFPIIVRLVVSISILVCLIVFVFVFLESVIQKRNHLLRENRKQLEKWHRKYNEMQCDTVSSRQIIRDKCSRIKYKMNNPPQQPDILKITVQSVSESINIFIESLSMKALLSIVVVCFSAKVIPSFIK